MDALMSLIGFKIILGYFLFFAILTVIAQCLMICFYFLFVRKTPRMSVPFFIIGVVALLVDLILIR